jgi:alpha-L-fucosidase
MEMIGFIHFSINTFTDKEWGYGDESPGLFNPSSLDAEQWARTAKEAGMKQLILTAKHHDGFCLWPSAYTEHSVKNSPWKNGKGDLVKEFIEACRRNGLKAGLYLSPWDRNHKDYGTEVYLDYYRNQLTELLSNYGEISEIWFDGANGGDGYYGGANEIRKIDRGTYYDWDSTFNLVYSLQPEIIIFSDAGPGCRWIGNEHGIAGETNWSTINGDSLTIGGSGQAYLNTGDPNGPDWIPGECDVSIRPGWFYHSAQDEEVKSLTELINIYYGSVGRNGVLLLNIPPDQRGLIHENDVARLEEFSEYIKTTFEHPLFYLDTISEVIDLGDAISFDLILVGEDISKGQRVHDFKIEGWIDGKWTFIAGGTTIGHKRILKTEPIKTSRLKITFESDIGSPIINKFGLYQEAQPPEKQ